MNQPGSLFLNTGSAVQCKIHPVVLFSILDHYIRRHEGQDRVIGTLLGVNNDGVIEIRNCFPVPHNETEDQVAVDTDFHKTMGELHSRMTNKETIVGWYGTGVSITNNCTLIHSFYEKECPQPVHLLVNPDAINDNMGVKAFYNNNLTILDQELGSQFQMAKLEIKTFEAERIGVDLLTKAKKTEGADDAGSLLNDLESLELSIRNLYEMLDNVSNYVKKVLDKSIPEDKSIGRYLMETLAAVPHVDAQTFDKMFANSLQDLLMVVYLANLTRTQLALAEKLQNAV